MPTPPPKPPVPRYHVSTATGPTLEPGTLTIRLAVVPEAEWQWLEPLLRERGWKSY